MTLLPSRLIWLASPSSFASVEGKTIPSKSELRDQGRGIKAHRRDFIDRAWPWDGVRAELPNAAFTEFHLLRD